MGLAQEFLAASRSYLIDEYEPKIVRCLEQLDDDQVWWRPNERSNSVGNLVLHLAGNIRQYVVSGVGGAPDTRRRDEEFAAKGGLTREELIEHLRRTLAEVDAVLSDLDSSTLTGQREIQGRSRTVFEALFHAVEHFSGHTGQIIQLTKQITDRDLEFYAFRDGSFRKTWQER